MQYCILNSLFANELFYFIFITIYRGQGPRQNILHNNEKKEKYKKLVTTAVITSKKYMYIKKNIFRDQLNYNLGVTHKKIKIRE